MAQKYMTKTHGKSCFLWLDLVNSEKTMDSIGLNQYSKLLSDFYSELKEKTLVYNLESISELGDGTGLKPKNPEDVDSLLKTFLEMYEYCEAELNIKIRGGIDWGNYEVSKIPFNHTQRKIFVGTIVKASRYQLISKKLDEPLTISKFAHSKIKSDSLKKLFKSRSGNFFAKNKVSNSIYVLASKKIKEIFRNSKKIENYITKKRNLYILYSPSGGGKTFLMQQLAQNQFPFKSFPVYTNRKKLISENSSNTTMIFEKFLGQFEKRSKSGEFFFEFDLGDVKLGFSKKHLIDLLGEKEDYIVQSPMNHYFRLIKSIQEFNQNQEFDIFPVVMFYSKQKLNLLKARMLKKGIPEFRIQERLKIIAQEIDMFDKEMLKIQSELRLEPLIFEMKSDESIFKQVIPFFKKKYQ